VNLKFKDMDITRLRICTFKSRADFYYNSDWTVEKLWNDNPVYLLSVYYENEKISFTEDVLNVFKVRYPDFFRIEKPGKYMGQWRNEIFGPREKTDWSCKTYEELLNTIRAFKIEGKKIPTELYSCFTISRINRKLIKDNSDLDVSKKELQGINQGHK